MSDMTVATARDLEEIVRFRSDTNSLLIGQLARAYIAQDAELTRLRARIDAADKLAEALADAAGALDSAGEELSDFANILSRDPWQANHAYESAVQARAALSAYEESKE